MKIDFRLLKPSTQNSPYEVWHTNTEKYKSFCGEVTNYAGDDDWSFTLIIGAADADGDGRYIIDYFFEEGYGKTPFHKTKESAMRRMEELVEEEG